MFFVLKCNVRKINDSIVHYEIIALSNVIQGIIIVIKNENYNSYIEITITLSIVDITFKSIRNAHRINWWNILVVHSNLFFIVRPKRFLDDRKV